MSGNSGRFGYSSTDKVGSNFALPLVTRTRVLKTKVIGLFGKALEISASKRPDTKTFPFSLTSVHESALCWRSQIRGR